MEVKGTSDNTWLTSKGAQATKYWDKYRLVLVTNYRESRLMGRALRPDEAAHFTHMARRIAALLALGPELDGNYRAHTGA